MHAHVRTVRVRTVMNGTSVNYRTITSESAEYRGLEGRGPLC